MKLVMSVNTPKDVIQTAISEIIRAVSYDVSPDHASEPPLQSASGGDN